VLIKFRFLQKGGAPPAYPKSLAYLDAAERRKSPREGSKWVPPERLCLWAAIARRPARPALRLS